MDNYWEEHAQIAMDEAGIKDVTPEQIDAIAGVIESAHEFYGQSMGHDVAGANYRAMVRDENKGEIAALKKEIERLEGDLNIFRNSVARRRKCDPNNVELERYGNGRGAVLYSYR